VLLAYKLVIHLGREPCVIRKTLRSRASHNMVMTRKKKKKTKLIAFCIMYCACCVVGWAHAGIVATSFGVALTTHPSRADVPYAAVAVALHDAITALAVAVAYSHARCCVCVCPCIAFWSVTHPCMGSQIVRAHVCPCAGS
jgi:hypothetical protein